MSIFDGYFDDFGLFRQICFLLAVITLLLLISVWPALLNSLGTNAPAVYYTLIAMLLAIGLGFTGATVPFLLSKRKYKIL